MTADMGGDERVVTIHGHGVGDVATFVVKAAQERGYSVAATGPGQFRMVRQERPVWAVVAAILGFPFLGLGLLFLLVKKVDSGSVAVFDGRDGTKVRFVGAIDEDIVDALLRVSDSGSRVREPLPPPPGSQRDVVGGARRASQPPAPSPDPDSAQDRHRAVGVPSARLVPPPAEPPTVIDASPLMRSDRLGSATDPSTDETVARPKQRRGSDESVAVVLPDGRSEPLGTGVVIGRDPEPPHGKQGLSPVAYQDASLSKTHMMVEPKGSRIEVTDLHSTNGTCIVDSGTETPCAPGVSTTLPEGAEILAGDVTVRIRVHR